VTVRIGLTGPMGCGKSTVAHWLAAHAGVAIVDADAEARLALAPGTPEVAAVYARFGDSVRGPGDELDRAALGRIVFEDATALRDLEAIVHPAVRPRILEVIGRAEAAGARAVVIEAIKLVEGGLADLCDEVWLVTCDPTTQLERLQGRGADEADARARVTAQGDIRDRLAGRATRTLDTSSGADEVRAAAESMLEAALAAAAS
jgi:dephospho-CoA kinase